MDRARSQVLSHAFEERVPHLSLSRLRPIFNLRIDLGLNPDTLVRDALGVRLGCTDQGHQTFAQIGGGLRIEAMVDLTGINQIGAFASADIDPVPLVAVQCEAGDGPCLALRAGFLDPVIAAAGRVAAVADLGDDALEPDLAGCL